MKFSQRLLQTLLIAGMGAFATGCEAQQPDPATASVSPIMLPNGALWHGLTDPPPDTAFRSDHPRLLVTPETIPALREKLADPRYAADVAKVRSSNNGTDKAFCYLVWQDEAKGREAITSLLNWDHKAWHSMERAAKRVQGVLMYDWLYNLMTPSQREQAAELVGSKVWEGPGDVRYFHSDHFTDHSYDHLLATLALDTEEARNRRLELLDPEFNGLKVYHGLLDILTSSSLSKGGGWHAGASKAILDGYEAGFGVYGGPLLLRAWETSTGQSMFDQTTYFDRLPYDVACARMGIQASMGKFGKTALEFCTGQNAPESAGLAAWILDKYGWLSNDNPNRIPRMLLGDRRVRPRSPQELNIPLYGYQDGSNCVYVRSSWDDSATKFLFFARHWDRGRYEQESGQLVIHKANVPVLPLSTEGKSIAHEAFTSLRVFGPDGDKSQKSTYWSRTRANHPKHVTAINRPQHRPETLVHLSESNGAITAVSRFEKLLKVDTPVAQRRVVIDPSAETVEVEDHVELARGLKAEVTFGLPEEPRITNNIAETSTLKITVRGAFQGMRWDSSEREKNHRGSMWIKGTLIIDPTVENGEVNSSVLLEVK